MITKTGKQELYKVANSAAMSQYLADKYGVSREEILVLKKLRPDVYEQLIDGVDPADIDKRGGVIKRTLANMLGWGGAGAGLGAVAGGALLPVLTKGGFGGSTLGPISGALAGAIGGGIGGAKLSAIPALLYQLGKKDSNDISNGVIDKLRAAALLKQDSEQ